MTTTTEIGVPFLSASYNFNNTTHKKNINCVNVLLTELEKIGRNIFNKENYLISSKFKVESTISAFGNMDEQFAKVIGVKPNIGGGELYTIYRVNRDLTFDIINTTNSINELEKLF